MSQRLCLVIAQLNFLVGDVSGNTQKIIDAAGRARDEHQADAILFPELTLSGYPPEDLLLRPGLHRRVEHALSRIQSQVKGIDVILGFPESTEKGLFNAATVLRGGKRIATYHKSQLPNYSVFDEKRYFIAGDKPCVVDIAGVSVGLTICEDIWHSKPAMDAKHAGARLILNLNASPFHRAKSSEREVELQKRVQETGLPIVYANLMGGQDELVFDGGSLVMTATGDVSQRFPIFEEGLYPVTFLIDDSGKVTPQAGDCAPIASDVESVYQALVLGVRDYVRKNGFPGVLIGLSGGIDSALTLAITVDAIGAENVEAVMMPSRYTMDMSVEDAREQTDNQGVKHRVLPIEPAFNAFLATLQDAFDGTTPDATEENIQARCRGVLLMALSNKGHKVVITTGNKSEMAVGYATLYGDMAGGYSALKDVPKTLVYALSHYRNRLSPVIPQRVIDRPPSAELAEDQQDSDSLPPYDVLDAILEKYIEQDQCAEDIVAAGYDANTVERVIMLVNRNEYKRRQAAPGVRITQRAFGRDRRYPITSGYDRS
ncbi:MAG: NAD+ synthase [Ectothiorhodospiraceae bacterium]|nr:NAD+ synthase [Ectothiorhodospiraceae bacterium]